MIASPSEAWYVGSKIKGKRIDMVPHEVPVARAMKKEMTKDNVGSASGLTPPTIQAENSRSAPTSIMTAPLAQAKVNTIKAGKMRPIPYKKASTDSPTPSKK